MTKDLNLEAVNGALGREVRKLQEELKAADKANADLITALRAENEKLREWNREIALNAREFAAENEKLRAALEVFACDCEGKAICLGNCMHRNARAALEERT